MKLVLLGSGETSPNMAKHHARYLKDAKSPALIDSTFGFQVNADDLTQKITGYFAESVQRRIGVISALDEFVDNDKLHAELAQTDWLFAGPGSPTYALRVWKSLQLQQSLLRVIQQGSLVLSSAAAVTAGKFALPVYEIYKVGEAPVWREGLDLLGALTGWSAAVIPHFDNAEGGRHDTRYCYVGQARLDVLECNLGDHDFVLGIDEHTGLELDFEAKTFSVFGKGGVTIRRSGGAARFAEVESAPLADLVDVQPVIEITPVEIEPQVTAPATEMVKAEIDPFVDELLRLRTLARSEGRWAESDSVREFLAGQGIIVEDGAGVTKWRHQPTDS